MENLRRKSLTPELSFQKAKHYCAYQERCHKEVKEKLYSFGLRKSDVEQLLSRLIEADYLNEERFSVQFAGGKFRMKQWGKVKIAYALKQKGVSPYNIKKAIKEIDEDEYADVLKKLAGKKWKDYKGSQHMARQVKTQNYLMQKGYEPQLIRKAIQELRRQSET